MSPRTSTWTEIFAPVSSNSREGESLTYRLGSNKRMIVNVVEAMTARVKSISIIISAHPSSAMSR